MINLRMLGFGPHWMMNTQIQVVKGCHRLAVAGNKSAMRPLCSPSPRWGAEENRKKQKAKTGGWG